jgi:hypothetical protein
MLGEAHGPTGDDLCFVFQNSSRLLQLRPADAALPDQVLQVEALQMIDEIVVARCVVSDKGGVEDSARMLQLLAQQQDLQRLQQRHVPVDLYRQENIGQRRAEAQHAFHLLRVAEAHQAGFRQGVDRDDGGALCLCFLQGAEHARMVGARVLAQDHDDLGLVKVFQFHRPFADAQRFAQGYAAALMAHIAAVGQVIGAILPHEKLVQESCFIAGAARSIEHRLIG